MQENVTQDAKKKVLSLNDAAECLSLSVWTLRAWAQTGKIPTVKIGARRMVRVEVVREIAERGLN